MKGNRESHISFIASVKEALGLALCDAIKFLYGFLFGSFMWSVIVKPYGKYYDFESSSYWPEFVFSILAAIIYMASLKARCVMVLFLPSMIGNATQNYVIVLLFVALFTQPVSSIGFNAVESVRVIGCSLTMAFESLKERAKLILNPIVEVLNDRQKTDLEPIKNDLINIQQIINEMRNGAQLSQQVNNSHKRNKPKIIWKSKLTTTTKPMVEPVTTIYNDRVNYSDKGDTAARQAVAADILSNKTKKLIQKAKFELDPANFGVKASVDVNELRDLVKSNRRFAAGEFNLTESLYVSCLNIFRDAKQNCQIVLDEMLDTCKKNVGPYFATLWCSPVLFTFRSTCPWIMDQLVDESSICQQIRNSSLIKVNLGTNKNIDVNELFRNLSRQVTDLNEDLFPQEQLKSERPRRLELSITFNERTRNIFLKTHELIKFVQDKYKIRRLFLDVILFFYDLYTTYTFLLIMFQAWTYRQNYLNQIRFDNYYITGAFIGLDRRLKAQGKRAVLPLTQDESKMYITTFTCKRRTREERDYQQASCTMIILFIAFTLSLIYLDNIFHSILISIRQHALIHYREIGHHELDVKVFGEGSIARLVKRLTARLNSVYNLDRLTSNRNCLPVPRETSNRFYLEFAGFVLIYLMIDQISIYAMRLRRLTCAFFYPQNEYQRIYFLRNFILYQRDNFEKLAVKSYLDDDDNDNDNNLKDNDVFTLRDALIYLGKCVKNSLQFCDCRQEQGRFGCGS